MQCNKNARGFVSRSRFFIALWVVAELLSALPL